MQVPVERSFRDLTESEIASANEVIDRRVARIERLAPDAISCRVAVSRPQAHQRSGSPFRARVRITLPPHKELVAAKDPHDSDAVDVVLILREVFDAVERQVLSAVARRDDHVQHIPHVEPSGIVVRLFSESGYGFIKDTDTGEELYFHRNSVTGGQFERVRVGTQVRFERIPGDEGPQASTVHIIDKPGARRMRDGWVEEYVPDPWKPGH